MKKLLIAIAVVVAIVAIVLVSGGRGEDGYVVRGIFDNSSFMVQGEEVRVAGATVGEIESVDVTMPGEIDSYSKSGEPQAVPGKAVVVMRINDPGFQDFRRDASCLIRPQSLIGEKFVDCRPTLPRAPGTEPPPPLKKIPDGQPGEGQYLLPLENNSTSVDPDLVNNIQRLPYSQRFRLILNELGAGLAGRGEDIEEAVKRANPVLRDADRLFAILAAQRDQLRAARGRLRADTHAAGAAARPRGRLLLQRRRCRGSDRRTRHGPGSLAAQAARLPARVPRDAAQPSGLLRSRDPGLHRTRAGGTVADERDPRVDAVQRRLHGLAEVARRHRRSRRPQAPGSGPDRPQGRRSWRRPAPARPQNLPSSSSA